MNKLIPVLFMIMKHIIICKLKKAECSLQYDTLGYCDQDINCNFQNVEDFPVYLLYEHRAG